jgi:hypothetical protein
VGRMRTKLLEDILSLCLRKSFFNAEDAKVAEEAIVTAAGGNDCTTHLHAAGLRHTEETPFAKNACEVVCSSILESDA